MVILVKKIVVIGGGASGMVAAIKASKNHEVLILEKYPNVGKKILITGNGKCNYFNDDFNIKHYISSNNEILKQIINDKYKNKILTFFNEIGVIPRIKNGYYYPYSNQAVSIQNILLTEIRNRKIQVKTSEIVENVIRYNNKFLVKTDKNTYECDNVVLATGSKACYDTVYDNFGYEIASSFGHSINSILPGLVQLKGNESYFKEWNGIRTDVAISLFVDDELIKEEKGEIQLTNYGISGICTMQLSNYAVPAINSNKSVEVKINFLDFLNIKTNLEFASFFKKRNNELKNRTVSELFDGIINYKLANLIFKLCDVKLDSKLNDLNESKILELGEKFISFKLKITDYNSFKDAQICLGGVDINEVNIETFESKKQKGLFIIGELLDISGECGGYNLGFAWLSGIIVGEYIGELND